MPKFIKTSERLPDKNGVYVVNIKFKSGKTASNRQYKVGEQFDDDVLEWLDESEEEIISFDLFKRITELYNSISIAVLIENFDNENKSLEGEEHLKEVYKRVCNHLNLKEDLADTQKELEILRNQNNHFKKQIVSMAETIKELQTIDDIDTMRLDWLENFNKDFTELYDLWYSSDAETLREFIDKQLKKE